MASSVPFPPGADAYPALDRYDNMPRARYIGPTEESNWVLPGRLLVGAYPSAVDDALNEKILTSILRLGVTTFVCLQKEYEHNSPEYLWRSGRALRPCVGLRWFLLQVGDWDVAAPDGLIFRCP